MLREDKKGRNPFFCMKIQQSNADHASGVSHRRWKRKYPQGNKNENQNAPPRRVRWGSWYVQAALFLFAFLLGAVVYRSGVLRPATLYLRSLFAPGALIDKIPEPVQEAAKNVEDEIRMYVDNGLPTLYIDMPFENYHKLLEKRNEALQLGILNTTDADFVDGQVHLQNGPTLDADLRLKGDWADHLEGDKWSFRIKIKNDGQVLGMRQFSIQTPAARNFLYEWAFHQHLIQEGVLTTRYQFVNVLFNGKLLGIYAMEDHFTGELIESQGRRQGLILRLNEDPMWQNLSVFWANQFVQESNLSVTNAWTASIDAFQENRLAEDPALSAEAETARDLLRAFQAGARPVEEVFDVGLWGRFYALHDLWHAQHGVAWHNLRFYYNPVTGLLEPVAFDAEPFYRHYSLVTISGDFIDAKIFNDPAVRAAYAKELYRLSDAGYVASLAAGLMPEHDRLRDALAVEFPLEDPGSDGSVAVDWDLLGQRAQSLFVELQPGVVVRGNYQAINVQPGSAGQPSLALDLVNLMMLPVDVLRVEINDRPLAVTGLVTLPPVIDPQEQGVQATHLVIPLDGNEGLGGDAPVKVEVVVRISGLEQEYQAELSGSRMPEGIQTGPVPRQPPLEQALARHPFLQSDPGQSNRLLIPPGTWDVEGDLVLPDQVALYVLAGTVLRFSEGSVLYSTGGLFLLGKPDAPVVLTAQAETWGGIVVLNSALSSEWQYSIVEKTAGISREGWIMTGGINFYQANITLDNTLLGNNLTEDAINVIHGKFQFKNCEFANTFADAFDSDFSTGEVTNCYFHDIAGDAVDVSGTTAVVSGSRMERIGDKGVSVGEQSQVRVEDTAMDTVGIGVASKDLSTTQVTRVTIRGASFAALAAYIKKPVFGPAEIEAQQVTIADTDQAAVAQVGSRIVIDGVEVGTVDLDVDRLYNEGVLGN